jgi:hypothetical protein
MKPARIAIVVLALTAAPAAAQTPAANIQSGGPLKNVWIGNELGCQIAHTADGSFELYPAATTPGDCGTLIASGGTLYAPNFSGHGNSAASGIGPSTAWTPASQSPVGGAGTSASPYNVTTVVTGGPFRVTEIDSYIPGQEAYRTDVTVENTSGGGVSGVLYRAGDCYLQSNDRGFGFVDGTAVGCSQNAGNQPAGRIEQWFPITGGNQFMEGVFTEVWQHIGTKTPFPNTAKTGEQVDNGAGISWTFDLAPGARATFAHYTVFSPTGAAGPPQPPSDPSAGGGPTGRTPPAFGPNGVITGLPSSRRCVSRRAFRIRIRRRRGRQYLSAAVFLNGRQVATRNGRRVTAPINLRGLPRGRYTVRIVVVTTTGEVIRGTRRYRTCERRRRGGRPGPL